MAYGIAVLPSGESSKSLLCLSFMIFVHIIIYVSTFHLQSFKIVCTTANLFELECGFNGRLWKGIGTWLQLTVTYRTCLIKECVLFGEELKFLKYGTICLRRKQIQLLLLSYTNEENRNVLKILYLPNRNSTAARKWCI